VEKFDRIHDNEIPDREEFGEWAYLGLEALTTAEDKVFIPNFNATMVESGIIWKLNRTLYDSAVQVRKFS
jgi:hypothetical protein